MKGLCFEWWAGGSTSGAIPLGIGRAFLLGVEDDLYMGGVDGEKTNKIV